MNEQTELYSAVAVLDLAITNAYDFSKADDRDASIVAILVRAIELATGRTVNMETMYDIRND